MVLLRLSVTMGLTSLLPETSCRLNVGTSWLLLKGGNSSVARGWMYMDWCLRITAWRPLPLASCSRWLTDSEMVRRPPPREEKNQQLFSILGQQWQSFKKRKFLPAEEVGGEVRRGC